MYSEVLDGSFTALDAAKMTTFPREGGEDPVIVHRVPFYAFCEHHLLPFQGTFAMGYIPGKRILGLSKVVRIFRHFCKRPTVQERITVQAVDALMEIAEPEGAICYVAADHMCMTLRGVKSPGSLTTTTASRGVYDSDGELRTQFLDEVRRSI